MSANFFTITNNIGHTLKFTNAGASIVSWIIPHSTLVELDIIIGLQKPSDYLKNDHFLGSTIGRVANRISKAKFKIKDNEYCLDKNEASNTLHSGNANFANRIWNVKSHQKDSVTFNLQSDHMDGGFPGNLEVEVMHSINDHGEWIIDYSATTDKKTILNLTNHAYFNLEGNKSKTILNHSLQVHANHYLPTDKDNLPTGVIQSVNGSKMDLRNAVIIDDLNLKTDTLFNNSEGLDHNYIISYQENNLAAILASSQTGLRLKCFTDQPGIQVYTGNHLHKLKTVNNKKFYQYQALCLEAQQFPDSINNAHFPSPIIQDKYNQNTIYRIENID